MRARPIVALSATLALLGGGSALGAVGDTADGPAAGSAASTLTLLDVGLGGKSVSLLELALRSDTLAGQPTTSFVVTPLSVDGTAYGRQSLSSRSAALPAVDTTALAPAAVSALAAARSPLVDVSVDGGSSRAGTTSLGAVSVLGLPLTLDGSTSISSVVDGAGASGSKTLTVSELALPSVADLLAALGLDLRALPTGTLTDVLEQLDLGTPATAAAQAALEEVLAPLLPQIAPAEALVAQVDDQVRSVLADVEAARAALVPATTALNDATRALGGLRGLPGGSGLRRGSLVGLDPLPTLASQPVTSVLPAAVAPVTGVLQPVLQPLPVPASEPVTAPVTDLVQDVVQPVLQNPGSTVDAALDAALGAVTQPVLTPVVDALPTLPAVLPLPTLPVVIPVSLQPVADAYTTAKATYDRALQTVRDAEAALLTVTAQLADAKSTVEALLAPQKARVDALVSSVVGALDATPLLSLDRLEVTTRSAATSASAGGQSAEVVGGEVQGLRVLGADVLLSALGTSEVSVLDLAGPAKARVDGAISALTTGLSSTLSAVPGLPALEVPAPSIELLTRATSTSVADGFGVAGSALRAVSVTWPGITVPAAAALPAAATLPAVAGLPHCRACPPCAPHPW